MKLIYCPYCHDIIKLRRQVTICECGKSFGTYLDDLNAAYSGDAVPLGIANSSFIGALKNQPASGDGMRFEAFVIPKDCLTFKRIKRINSTEPIPYTWGPMGPKCRDALQALIESMDSALPGVINREGAILVRNHLARRLGIKRFGPNERYMVFELTVMGVQVCRDLGLVPDEGIALSLASDKEVTFGGRKTGVKRGPRRRIQPKR